MRNTRGRTMKKRRKHETDAVFLQTTLHDFRGGGRVHAESLQHIGAARVRGCGTRAVLGHGQTGTRNDERSRGRYVERLYLTRAGAGRVNQLALRSIETNGAGA